MISRHIIFALVLLLSACSATQQFRVEPTNLRTFATPKPLKKGDVLEVRITGLGSKQRLRLHQCGPRCNTAESIATWEASQLPPDGEIQIQVPAKAEYYFWVEDFTEVKGKYGAALKVLSSTQSPAGLVVSYDSNLVIVVSQVRSNNSFKPNPLRGSA